MLFLAGAVFAFAAPSLVRGRRPGWVDSPWFPRIALGAVAVWWVVRNL